jgi:Transglutaminase-like superfamily
LKPMLRPIIDDCRQFRLLTHFERILVLESMLGLAATRVGLRLTGYQRWKNMILWLTRKKSWSAPAEPAAATAEKIARIERASARRFPFRTNCLEQSLVLLWLLRQRGIGAELRIGGRKEANRFEAHAWVELEGAVLNDAGETHLHFVPFQDQVSSLETQAH